LGVTAFEIKAGAGKTATGGGGTCAGAGAGTDANGGANGGAGGAGGEAQAASNKPEHSTCQRQSLLRRVGNWVFMAVFPEARSQGAEVKR
jgi:hypothetical protein